jgi:4-hydroxy-4-methyl-2-oxoglutarate aldolase
MVVMIVDPPVLSIRRHFERSEEAVITQFRGRPTSAVADAMGGRGALHHRIKPIDPNNCTFVGCALTCETGASDNLAILAALAIARPGDVIIAASEGFEGAAVVGDNVALMARNRGVAALVIDGMARDATGIVDAQVPVFARGLTPNSCVRSGPGRVGMPIIIGGVAVEAGDIVVGDLDGVVIVPRRTAAAVSAQLTEIIQAEATLQARIKAGASELEAVAQLLSSGKVDYLD